MKSKALDGLGNRFEMAEERVSKLEERSIDSFKIIEKRNMEEKYEKPQRPMANTEQANNSTPRMRRHNAAEKYLKI